DMFTDNPDDIISPCLCKGGSAYIHRNCLNDWRAENIGGKAFKFCSVCQFEYVIESITDSSEDERKRLRKYRLLVIRDITLLFLPVQAIIVTLAFLTKFVDKTGNHIKQLFPSSMNALMIYYVSGFILFLALLGLVSLIVVCCALRNDYGNNRNNHRSTRSSSYRSNSNSRNARGLVAIVVGIVLVFAFIGIFVGIILGVVIVRLILKSHTNKLWLRQEAEKYIVRDFQGRRNEIEKYTKGDNLFTNSLTDINSANDTAQTQTLPLSPVQYSSSFATNTHLEQDNDCDL
ncbi:unnamed protein product, partial [Didymodactylos carnosus]